MSVDEGYESERDLLDVEDIGKDADFPLPLYLADDELCKNIELDNFSSVIKSVAAADLPSTEYQFFFKEQLDG